MPGSFKLNDNTLEPQPTINEPTATLNLGDLSRGTHTITYDSVMKPNVSVDNQAWINELDGSKNKANWTWGQNNEISNSCEGKANKFRYDMIKKDNGTGTPSDIKWTVILNQGELKADMSGYVFTDTLDDKQAYTGSFAVYKGDSESSGAEIKKGDLDPKEDSFTYTFPDNLEDKYATYCIVYHTKMNDTSSYDTVHNNATIKH